MNEAIFRQLYLQRAKYPIGARTINQDDKDYIKDEIARQAGQEIVFLLFPVHFFDRLDREQIEERFGSELTLAGVFDVGRIFSPVVGIKFYLYAFGRRAPAKIWFGELMNSLQPFSHSSKILTRDGFFLPECGEFEKYFLKFLSSIDLAMGGEKKTDYVSPEYRMFAVDSSAVQDRTSIDFYKPELIETETKYAHEKTVLLGDIAQIIRPTQIQDDTKQLFSVKLAEAAYPLRSISLKPIRENARIAKIIKGDIVTNRFLNSAYQNLTDRNDLAIANSQLIIRLHDQRFNAAYLTAYLNSASMRAYFERHKRGAIIPMIRNDDLASFPIVVPNKRTNQAAAHFLSSLSEFDSSAKRLEAIDRVLFTRHHILDKPLQNELLAELHKQLQVGKNTDLRKLFDIDLHEIEKCYKSGAYKGCLVLCGSLLETLALDWLTDIDGEDYFKSSAVLKLDNLINRLKTAGAIDQREAQIAHEIRKKRNLIHPKNYMIAPTIHKETCVDVMQNLKTLVAKRYNNML